MNTLDAIQERRSIKHFDPEYRIPEKELEKILSLAMLSPTAFNIQNWRFLVVTDEARRKALRDAAWGQSQVTDASALIVICADLKAWEKEPARYWRNADQDSSSAMVNMIDQYYRNKEQVQRDEGLRSCGIAAQTLMLAAKAMGYDSNPMDGFDFDQVAEIIKLPNDHIVTMFVALGKPLIAARVRGGQLPLNEVVIYNHF